MSQKTTLVSVVKPWRLDVSASKRNVFFVLSNPQNRVKKILTPGVLRKKGVTKQEYLQIDDKKLRRKKRSLRVYLNRQKVSRPACAQTWSLMRTYLKRYKLLSQPFLITLSGSNLKLSRAIVKKIIEKNSFRTIQIFIKQSLPHNGCPQRIQKRKKNKGRNRYRKRSLIHVRPSQLPRTRGLHGKIIRQNDPMSGEFSRYWINYTRERLFRKPTLKRPLIKLFKHTILKNYDTNKEKKTNLLIKKRKSFRVKKTINSKTKKKIQIKNKFVKKI